MHPPEREEGISIVVPACEEAENLSYIVQSTGAAFAGHPRWELIVVDDGSQDGTPSVLAGLQREASRLRVIRHATRCGQSSAICTGADVARYPWIGFLDADGQTDPRDLERLYRQALETELRSSVMIMGHRRRRADHWLRRVSSRVANSVRTAVLHDAAPDTGCSIKVLPRRDFVALPRFDHMHRFLPALLLHRGVSTISRPVVHHPRRAGRSKYGLNDRLWAGVVDLLGVWWLGRRRLPSADAEERNGAIP